MVRCQPSLPLRNLPRLWLISDARNDALLERALRRLPRGSGFVFRHYHLAPAERRARFEALKRAARARGHVVILAGDPREAAAWRADGSYCSQPARDRKFKSLSLMTAHSLREIGRCGHADAVFVSPVFPTRSHPGARTLGPLRFRLLAARSQVPAIALGGMDARGAHRLRHTAWAAIDGLTREDS